MEAREQRGVDRVSLHRGTCDTDSETPGIVECAHFTLVMHNTHVHADSL